MSRRLDVPKRALALIHDTGNDTLSVETLPVPDPKGAEQHLILVKAVALTNGELKWPEPASCSPAIPGYEVSGTVMSAPPGSHFPVGSEVYARTSFHRQGNARQYSIALAGEMGHKPKNISWSQAATVPLSALTAWQALFVHGGFEPPGGDTAKNGTRRVLVTAAAGGVGIWAIQLARLAGIGVIIATCGPANISFVQSLGAHEAVDYAKHADLTTWIKSRGREKFDVVLDCVGEVSLGQSWMAVKEGGRLISIVMPPDSQKPLVGIEAAVKGIFFIVEANASQLRKISTLLEKGECKAVVDSAYSLQNYSEAWGRLQGGHLTGKVVLTL